MKNIMCNIPTFLLGTSFFMDCEKSHKSQWKYEVKYDLHEIFTQHKKT